MSKNDQTEPSGQDEGLKRKAAYKAPRLVRYGSVTDLTRVIGGTLYENPNGRHHKTND